MYLEKIFRLISYITFDFAFKEAQQDDGSLAEPINTTVCWSEAARPMRFAIDAATQVRACVHMCVYVRCVFVHVYAHVLYMTVIWHS